MTDHVPTAINLHRKSAVLELQYADGSIFKLSAEFLRVHSPSAEVRGHGKGQEVLQVGKRRLQITGIEQTGNYALKLNFDDGHTSGIYSWNYLYELGTQSEALWDAYLEKLAAANASRDALPPDTQVINIGGLSDKPSNSND